MSKVKKKVKVIKVDLDKCNGCRACEVACAGFHANPKFSSINPARSRIRMVINPLNDEYVPIRAAEYTRSECDGRNVYTINGKEYSECSFCGASCPARNIFKEPDSGLPLRCDMCEDDPILEKPMCVQWCLAEALTYAEYEEDVEEQERLGDMEIGLKALIDKHGLEKLVNTITRMNLKG